jgi:predicted MFS family arabinose efflux permease
VLACLYRLGIKRGLAHSNPIFRCWSWGSPLAAPAYSALLPTLVEPEDLANAISMNSIQFNLARIIGPTLGGLAYTLFGAAWCFALNGISYAAAIGSLIVIKGAIRGT